MYAGLRGGLALNVEAHLAVERGDGDAEHAGGLFPGAAVVLEGFLNEGALLPLDEVIERGADRQLGDALGGGRGGNLDLLRDFRGRRGGRGRFPRRRRRVQWRCAAR